MTKAATWVAVLAASLLVGSAVPEASVNRSPRQGGGLIESLRTAFQEVNPKLDRVTIMEVRLLTHPLEGTADFRYVLLAHAARNSQVSAGGPVDQLFGVFEVDAGLTRVVRTLGSIPSPGFYAVWIESVDTNFVVVVGEGATYRNDPRRWIFKVTTEPTS